MTAARRHGPGDGRPAAALPAAIRRRVWWRSLALQATWNELRMQSLGLLFALEPWRRCRWPGRAARRAFWRRHLGFFNTNPYAAGLVIGWLARAEAETGGDDARLPAYKDSLARSVAALGDQLFWLGLQPLLCAAAVLLAWHGAGGWALAPVCLFALVQLVLRDRLLAAGFRAGMAVPTLLAHPAWHRTIALAKRAGAVLAGGLLGEALLRLPWHGGSGTDTGIGFAVVLLTATLVRRRWPGEAVLLVMAPLALALAIS